MIWIIQYLGAACSNRGFLNFPTWYTYLDSHQTTTTEGYTTCTPVMDNINNVWLIALAIVEMMLWVAGLAAIIFIIYGGIQYTLSQGDPEKTARAKNTLLNAVIGLVIAVSATAIITFIGGQFRTS